MLHGIVTDSCSPLAFELPRKLWLSRVGPGVAHATRYTLALLFWSVAASMQTRGDEAAGEQVMQGGRELTEG